MEKREPYALFLEPDLRGILVELEAINKSYYVLNRNLLQAWISPGCWTMWISDTKEGVYDVHGFIVPPKLLHTPMVVKANGQVLDDFVYPIASAVDDRILPNSARQFGFAAKLDCAKLQFPECPVHFTCVSASGETFYPDHMDFWLLASSDPLPSTENMKRVGATAHGPFILDGSTFYAKLDVLSRRYLGQPLNDVGPILDWGVGCGKMVRYFPQNRRNYITGVDIDPVNIEWDTKHIAGINFAVIEKRPPTGLPSSHFELVYGNSVFTHLREPDQFLWLEELRRIVKPNGLALVTIHGTYSFALLGWSEAYSVLTLLKQGMRVAESYNPDLGELGKDIYYDVAHSHQYIAEQWSKYFEVVDILEGYTMGELAMVVLRKKPDSAHPVVAGEQNISGLSVESLRTLANMSYQHGEFAKAGDLYQKVCQMLPSDVESLVYQAECRFRQGHLTLGRLLFEEAIAKGANAPMTLKRLAELEGALT